MYILKEPIVYFLTYNINLSFQCCLEDFNYSCDFIVLPTNGDTDLIEKFGKLSRHCYNNSCFTRPQSISIRKICNVANPLFLPESGGVGHVLNAGGWKQTKGKTFMKYFNFEKHLFSFIAVGSEVVCGITPWAFHQEG